MLSSVGRGIANEPFVSNLILDYSLAIAYTRISVESRTKVYLS